MNFSNDVLLVLLLSIFASANNIDLNTNTNFLLLLLLILSGLNTGCNSCGCNPCNVGGNCITCAGRFV